MKRIYVFLLALFAISCQKADYKHLTVFKGARIIDGTGSQAIENGVLIIKDGAVFKVGTQEAIPIPTHAKIIDASGKTIIPGLINTHAHVGYYDKVDAEHYSSKNIQEQLELYARFGITTVVSLGEDRKEAQAFQTKNDTSIALNRARLFIAGEIITGTNKEDAAKEVDVNVKNGTDFIKIRVDNNRGRSEAMKPQIYKTVIKQSHKNGLMTAAHMYDLEIAKDLVKSGADFLAHSVRDQEVDEEFINLLKTNKVCYCPTLTRDLSTFVYADSPSFFKDAFFLENANTHELEMLLDPERQRGIRNSDSFEANKNALKMAKTNLGKLVKAGLPICMGTDSGMPTRFQGYFEHLEMELMQESGMTPEQIIKSATGDAAEYLKLKDLGTLQEGKIADFILLDANPLENIRNSRAISSVWIGGEVLKK